MEQLIWKHPVAIIFYLLYTSICIRLIYLVVQFHERLKLQPGIGGVAAGGEGVQQVAIGLVLFAIIFGVVSSCYAIGSKKETRFYLWLIAILIVQTIVVLHIG